MVSDDEGAIVVAADNRGIRMLDREQPVRRWVSAKKWIDLEKAR